MYAATLGHPTVWELLHTQGGPHCNNALGHWKIIDHEISSDSYMTVFPGPRRHETLYITFPVSRLERSGIIVGSGVWSTVIVREVIRTCRSVVIQKKLRVLLYNS